MRRTPITLLATVALAFGCANSNNQSEAENPDAVASDSGAAGEEGAEGSEGSDIRKGKDQTGARGLGIPNKAVKKIAAEKPPRPEETDEPSTDEPSPHGLLAAYYTIDAATDALPDFSAFAQADAVAIVDSLDFRGSFPGLPDAMAKSFAAQFMGSLNVTTGAEYNLCLTSSDGSMLALDGNLIVDNEGVHDSQQKCELVYMDPGEYQLNVIYFNVSDPILSVTWDIGGAGEQVIPNEALFKPEGADDLVK